ncbi:hypothetical protein ACFS07_11020 [Undibacterium arcticum]
MTILAGAEKSWISEIFLLSKDDLRLHGQGTIPEKLLPEKPAQCFHALLSTLKRRKISIGIACLSLHTIDIGLSPS